MVQKSLWLIAVAGFAVVGSGCWARAGVHSYPVSGGYVVYQPPPPPQAVVTNPPPAPYAGAAWVNGHWQWNGASYVWVDGYYVQAPQQGYVYAQPHWEQRGSGWVYMQGQWSTPRRGAVHVQPAQSSRSRGTVQVQPAQPQQRRGRVQVQVR